MESPYRILVVDDELFHHILLKEIFSDARYQVFSARNGKEAIDLISGNEYDVIIMDHMMPGETGLEVCKKIRTEMKIEHLPIIMVTGHGTPEMQAECIKSGANDFVAKPYSPIVLKARVDAAASHYRLLGQLDNAEHIMFALACMVESRDKTTGDHCNRLTHMATVFGEELGLSFQELEALRRGGVLHDIGKVAIPDSILLKPGSLDDGEWEIMRKHTVIGYELCSRLPSMKAVSVIVRSHHEQWNGGGYPDGLKGEEIPLLARIFKILDIYDALSSERPYKKAFSQEKIIKILKEEAEEGGCDPHLMEVFLGILESTPQKLKLLAKQESLCDCSETSSDALTPHRVDSTDNTQISLS